MIICKYLLSVLSVRYAKLTFAALAAIYNSLYVGQRRPNAHKESDGANKKKN